MRLVTSWIQSIVNPNAEHVWHLFVLRVWEHDRVQAKLQEQGIATGVHHPTRCTSNQHLEIPGGALPVLRG